MLAIAVLTAAERRPQDAGHAALAVLRRALKEAAKVRAPALLDVYEMLERRLGHSLPWRWLHALGERAGHALPPASCSP